LGDLLLKLVFTLFFGLNMRKKRIFWKPRKVDFSSFEAERKVGIYGSTLLLLLGVVHEAGL